MITEDQYNQAVQQKESADKIISDYHKQKTDQFNERLNSGKPFTDDELRYAATSLCPCGHGLAYPKDCSPNHYWDCSAILKGIAEPTIEHSAQLPFAFYSIKSEDQPSSYGSTTRGVFKPKPRTPLTTITSK